MSGDDFEYYLRSVPAFVDIHFSGFSEPWHNPNCTEFVEIAHSRGHRVGVFTTADGISQDDVLRLSSIPFKRFTVHLPDNDRMMKLTVNDEYIGVLSALIARGIHSLEFMTIGNVHHQIDRIINNIGVTRRIHSRASNIVVSETKLKSSPSEAYLRNRTHNISITCRRNRQYANVLLPDGGVYLCSMDYSLEEPIGSLRDETYNNIVSGYLFRNILDRMSNPDSDLLCRKCEYAIASN